MAQGNRDEGRQLIAPKGALEAHVQRAIALNLPSWPNLSIGYVEGRCTMADTGETGRVPQEKSKAFRYCPRPSSSTLQPQDP